MLVTDLDKVVLHMPRCGGSSVRWAINSAGYKYKFSCEHANISSLPDKYKHLPTIGFIRNPIDWYVSWYSFLNDLRRKKRKGCFIVGALSDDYRLSFGQLLPRLLDIEGFLTENPDYLMEIKDRFRIRVMNDYLCWLNTYFDDISTITPSDFKGSLFNWYYQKVGMSTCNEVYRLEDGLQYGIDKAFPDKNIKVGHRNSSNPYMKQLNRGTMNQLIYNADKEYFIKYGYSF